MKRASLILWLVVAVATRARSADPPKIIVGSCSGCHELNGNSELPYIPRLAGLSELYLTSRIVAFRKSNRPPVDELIHIRSRPAANSRTANALMVGVSHTVSDNDLAQAAHWYASQSPLPSRVQKSNAVDTGALLYTKGDVSRNVNACEPCHGIKGRGTDMAPRLAGQNEEYLRIQLESFQKSQRVNSVMSSVASRLDRDEIRSLATYLQGLR